MKYLIIIECGKMDGGQALALLERMKIKNTIITPERLLEATWEQVHKRNSLEREKHIPQFAEITPADIQKALEEMKP